MRLIRSVVSVVFLSLCLICSKGAVNGFEVQKGERLEYSTKYLNIIPLGKTYTEVADIVDYEGEKALLITCGASTAKWISLFFKAEALLNAYIDAEKLYPYKFEQVLKVAGKPDDVRRATYDRVNNIMDAENKGKKKVPPDVRDPISAIYYLRTRELDQDVEITQMVNSNQSTYIFKSKVIGKRQVGKFDCWVLSSTIRRENKTMYHSMDALIYISDDERRLPVLIKVNTNVGPLRLELKEK